MDDKILIVLLIPTLVFAMISTIQSRRKRTRSVLRREWGAQTVQRETDKDTLDEIALYAKQKPMNERSSEYVDSVTWNDLDMDSVYRKLNRTQSNVGEEQLYAMLHEINVDDQTLERRNRWMNALSLDEPNRMALQAKLYQLGREHNHHTFSFLNNPGNSLPREAWVYYFLAVLPVVFLILGCTNALFFTGIAVSFLINTIVHYRTRMIWGAEQAAIR